MPVGSPDSDSIFHNPATRVRLNPDTYLRVDGTDKLFIQNVHCKEGVSIKYDILLILYELFEWKTVGELVAPWPPPDQEKIIHSLGMLHQDKIVITSETERTSSESGLSEHLGSRIVIDVENHHTMLRDVVRTTAYREAIRRNVSEGSVVLDLGSGSGILSFFAVQSGAKKVYAIEKRPDVVYLARALAQANGFDDRIDFVEGASGMVQESRLAEKPDVLIAEILGSGILEESILEFTIDARNRFLKPGGTLIPKGVDIYVFAFDSGVYPDRAQEVRELSDLYGIDLTLLGKVLQSKMSIDIQHYSQQNKTMAGPVIAQTLDLTTIQTTTFTDIFELKAREDGKITGFCVYFKAHLDDKVMLTNSPWSPQTHWRQLLFTLPEAMDVRKNDPIRLECLYDGFLRLRLLPTSE